MDSEVTLYVRGVPTKFPNSLSRPDTDLGIRRTGVVQELKEGGRVWTGHCLDSDLGHLRGRIYRKTQTFEHIKIPYVGSGSVERERDTIVGLSGGSR